MDERMVPERYAVTVLGPVLSSELGFVLPHEHVRIDNSIHHVAADGIEPSGPVRAEVLGELRARPHAVASNLVLDDDAAVIADLDRFRELGGESLVELTPRGMGRDLEYLATVARRTGLNIIAGTGFYVVRAHGSDVRDRTVAELAAIMTEDLGSEPYAAGVIGEIGISPEPHPDELRVLAAAIQAQRATGAPIWIHQTTLAPMRKLMDHLETAGANLDRIVLCHSDYDLRDLEPHRRALRMGLNIEMDLFGFPAWNRRNFLHVPDDRVRVERLLELAAVGHADQLLISTDVCLKTQLRAYGGFGYGHLLGNVAELFDTLGGDPQLWRRITRTNPARLLAWRR